ncbi:MAG: DUF58 domain-containing protein [Alphaproteobacteria bacterium]
MTLALDTLRQVQRIHIRTRRLVDGVFAGHYHSVFKGQGIEFAEVRDYVPGDDVRTIDWNVTARLGQPYVKRHVEERELTVMLLIDLSASGRFGSGARSKLDIALEIASLLTLSATRHHDKVGMVLFTDRIERFMAPRGGRNRAMRLILELLTFEPEGRGTEIGKALDYLQRALRKRTVTFLLSDFHGDPFETELRLVRRRHDLIPICIRDPRETALPDVGLIRLEDMETGRPIMVDTGDAAVRREFEKRQNEARAARRRLFSSFGLDVVEVDSAASYIHPLLRFFRQREQRLREGR